MQDLMGSRSDSPAAIEERGRRLRRISRIAEGISIAAIVLVAGYCIHLLFDEAARQAYLTRDVPGIWTRPGDGLMALTYALSVAPALIFAGAMWQARCLFRLFRGGRVLADAVPRRLVRLGILALAAAIADILVRTSVVLIMTIGNPPGERQLSIGFGSDELSFLVIGLLFLAFALVMREAQRIENELRGFV